MTDNVIEFYHEDGYGWINDPNALTEDALSKLSDRLLLNVLNITTHNILQLSTDEAFKDKGARDYSKVVQNQFLENRARQELFNRGKDI